MKSKLYKNLLFLLVGSGVAFYYLHPSPPEKEDRLIGKENIKQVLNKKINLVYVFTEWCGPCRATLKELYGNDLKKDELDLNVILIGASHAKKNQYEEIIEKANVEFPLFLLENKDVLSYKGFTDHPRIEKFIKENFNNYEDIRFNSVPITFYTDKDLNIIGKAKRDFKYLKQDIKNIKDSLGID